MEFSQHNKSGSKPHTGDHGWAPEADPMHGIFVAWGPDFKQGIEHWPNPQHRYLPVVAETAGSVTTCANRW